MCEAKALIDAFKLKKNLFVTSFNLYQKNNISLCVTGIGEFSTISAVSFLAGSGVIDAESVLINYGIAGCKDLPIGEFVEVNKITKEKRSFFPVKLYDFGFLERSLITVNEPAYEYPSGVLLDMESYGFYFASLKFVSMEQIWVAKVVSDNNCADLSEVSKEKVMKLMANHVDKIKKVIGFYGDLSKKIKDINSYPKEFYEIIKEVRFSFSEQVKLKRLVTQLLNKGKKVCVSDLVNLRNSKKIFCYLEEEIGSVYL